jgi:hypothetical protein
MVSIADFIRQVNEIIESDGLSEPINWNGLFLLNGYIPVEFSPKNKVCYDWCSEQFGSEHFAWTGSKFWFEREKDAIMFTLRWGRDN